MVWSAVATDTLPAWIGSTEPRLKPPTSFGLLPVTGPAWIGSIWRLPKRDRVMVVPGADHFATTSISPKWATTAPLRTIGEHAFYAAN